MTKLVLFFSHWKEIVSYLTWIMTIVGAHNPLRNQVCTVESSTMQLSALKRLKNIYISLSRYRENTSRCGTSYGSPVARHCRSFHIGLSARWNWGSFTNFQVFFVWYSKLNLKNCSKTLSQPTKRVVLWVWFEIEAKYPTYPSWHENCLNSKKNMSHIHIFEEKQWICYACASRYPICSTPNRSQIVLRS